MTQRTPQDEKHPRAKHSNAFVERIRYLREVEGWQIKQLSEHFAVPFYTVRNWCRYNRRKPPGAPND